MIHFIFGRPGTGKTYTVVERIRSLLAEPGDADGIYLLVPEQMAYSAERDVLSTLPPEAGRRFSILSFSRLSDMVSARCGGRSFSSLTRPMRSLLMWRNLRGLVGALEHFPSSDPDDTSLCRLMLSISTEMKSSGIRPEDLESASKQMDKESPLYHKLRDIALVTSTYDSLLEDVCGENPTDRLMRTAGQLCTHEIFKGAHVFIDGFTSFTAQEYAVLRAILPQAGDVTLTLCADDRQMKHVRFDSIRDTVNRLTRLCEDAGCEWEDEVLTEVRRTDSAELRALGDELWSFGLLPEERVNPPEEERGHISLVTAPNVYEEAQAAMLHIRDLRARGIPYERMAVVVRDAEAWRGVLDAAFEQYGIPCFLSERRGLSDLPAARLLLFALRCIRRGYQTEDVISLCKTGLCGVTLPDLDAFQEYVETWRIRGNRMTEGPWSMNPDGYEKVMSRRAERILEAANRVRESVIPPLLALESKLSLADRPHDQCAALYEFLCALSVRQQLSERAEALLGLGKTQEAGETVRLWSFLCETLASLVTVLPEDEGALPVDDLAAALSLVFDETDIGSVPARHDCVTVGSASTLRVDNVEAMLILGLCEGEFPQTVSDAGLLSEQEKSMLCDLDVVFDSRTERRTSEELLFVWRAVTKPSGELILFTHTSTPDGSAKAPSAVFSRVRFLFPYLEPIAFTESALGLSQDQLSYKIPASDRLSPRLTYGMLGDRINLSQSRLHSFAACPYSFYGSHVLKLRELGEARIKSNTAGTFLHKVFELYLHAALGPDKRIRVLDDKTVTDLAERIIRSCVYDLCGDVKDNGRLLHLFARLRAIALTLIHSIQRELEQGSFCVAGLEWDTHGKKDTDPLPLELEIVPHLCTEPQPADGTLPVPEELPFSPTLPGPLPLPGQSVRIVMGGIIDRVDVYRDGNTVYVRVIDYKSSVHTFTEKSVVEEMNVQLLLYLFTLCSPVNRRLFVDADGNLPDAVLPAEVLYISPRESSNNGTITPVRSGIILDEPSVVDAATPERLPEFLPDGKTSEKTNAVTASYVTRAKMQELQNTVETVIREAAAAIYEGRADRTPDEKACAFCIFRTGCPLAVTKTY